MITGMMITRLIVSIIIHCLIYIKKISLIHMYNTTNGILSSFVTAQLDVTPMSHVTKSNQQINQMSNQDVMKV